MDESEEKLDDTELEKELLSTLNIKVNTKNRHADKTPETHPHSCNICEENEEEFIPRFKTNCELIAHINAIHLKHKDFICTYIVNNTTQEQCNRSFPHKSNLQRHIKHVHLKIRNHKCTEKTKEGKACTKCFDSNSHLLRHINACHSNNRIEKCAYVCNEIHDKTIGVVCGMGFLDLTHLVDHLKRHIGICNFKCSECDSAFVSESELNCHTIRIHTKDQKKIICTECEKTFYTIGELTCHLRTHTGEKPYKCSICPMAFAWSTNLNRHICYHLGIKKYVCQVEKCTCSFVTSDELSRHHERIHTDKARVIIKRSEEETYKLLEQYLGIIRREYHVDFSCINKTFARIDFVYTMNDILFFIENDENQHKDNDVSYETQRMLDIKLALSECNIDLPIVWIRYNPHAYKIDSKTIKCSQDDRIKKVIYYIQECIDNKELLPEVSYCYCFYDVIDNKLCMSNSQEFSEEIKTTIHILN